MKITLGWWMFIVLETFAFISAFTWGLTKSALDPVLWGAQFFLLMPGNILVGPFLEKALWNTDLSLRSIGVIELIASITLNAVVWLLLLRILRYLRRLIRSNQSLQPTAGRSDV